MVQNSNSEIIEHIFINETENLTENRLVQQCFDAVGVFVAAIDIRGNVLMINKKGRDILGISNMDIIGKNFIEHFIEKDKKKHARQMFKQVILNQVTYPDKENFYLQNKINNETRIVEARNISIRNKENQILGILVSGEDITDFIDTEKNLQKDINLYRILANNVPKISLFIFNKNLECLIAEGKEMETLGIAKEKIEGKVISKISNPKVRERWTSLLSQALKGKDISTEFNINEHFHSLWILPIKDTDNKINGLMVITQNITDIKVTSIQLQKSKEESDKANQAKSAFLARVSHEIRTPLNAILGFTEQLLQTHLNKKQKQYLQIVDKSSEHLLSLINDILILSKIEANQVQFDQAPFKIEYTVTYVYNTLLFKAKEKNLRFSFDIDKNLNRVVLGDSFRLRQILLNMVGNAIKFTNQGYVEIRCFQQEETEDEIKVRFDVIDTGIGINPKNLNNIFEQFNQADTFITKNYGGTGLGLTICKNLIEMQNGSLQVSSQEGIGSTFSFMIPYKKGKSTDIVTDGTIEIDENKLRNKKVLIVDDDSVNRLLGQAILKKLGCKHNSAINGNEAIKKINKYKYDVILLDIHMPDISGLDVAEYIRHKKKDQETKIIAITAAAMKDDIQSYFKAGINDFLIKPFKELELYNKMCEILQLKKESVKKSKTEIILKEELSPKLYNLTNLQEMAGNDTSFMESMIKNIIENSEDTIRLFNQYLKENNSEQIAETAHKILPTYRHIEVKPLVNKLVAMRKQINIKDYQKIPKMVNDTNKLIKKLIKELKNEKIT